ncbi:anaerobic ribonucleoside-triphosphate reductase [Sporomusa paucivorans]|uniref:anaerobic ribonucleoside-triphosphate reductase n=1 Tax=Sporomusa paucivorans TaxID=2376 RepID=UPI0035711C64
MIVSNTIVIDDVLINYDNGITEEEIRQILAEERLLWLAKGKALGKMELSLDGDEIIVRAIEKSKIRRIRRITGYLSTEDRFNPSKQAELKDRKSHL